MGLLGSFCVFGVYFPTMTGISMGRRFMNMYVNGAVKNNDNCEDYYGCSEPFDTISA